MVVLTTETPEERNWDRQNATYLGSNSMKTKVYCTEYGAFALEKMGNESENRVSAGWRPSTDAGKTQ
jgi:hypothetical protein